MKLLDFMLNAEILQSACLFCFNESEINVNIDELIEIQNEDSTVLVTLRNVTKYLFSSYEILLNQACNSCTKLILTMYMLLKRAKSKIEAMEKLVNNINEEIIVAKSQSISKLYIDFSKVINWSKNEIEMINKSNYKPDDNLIKYNLCTVQIESKQHKNLTHSSCDKSLICVICGKTFKKPSSLKSHLNTHEEVECPHCFKTLKNNSHYNRHVKNHIKYTKKITKTRYKCDNCGHETRNKVDLTSHMYKCHLKIRPFVCVICRKQFYSQRNLNEHVLIHKRDKTNTCELCGDHFSGKRTLNNHLKLHSGYRSYKCDVCSHTFVTASRRNEHVKRKHGDKRFSCMLCEKKFGLNKGLNRHMKVCHRVCPKDCNIIPDRSVTCS